MSEGLDPYSFNSDPVLRAVDALPRITYPVIVIYLVFSPVLLTMEDMRALKIVEAYKRFVRLGQGRWILVQHDTQGNNKSIELHSKHLILQTRIIVFGASATVKKLEE